MAWLPVTGTSHVALTVVFSTSSTVRVAGGALGLTEADGESEADGLTLGDSEGETLGLGLEMTSRNATWMTWYSSAVAIVASSARDAAVVCWNS